MASSLLAPSCGRGFQLHRAREKDIIFEMYMLVKVCFKFLESFVQRFEAGAGVSGSVYSELKTRIRLIKSPATSCSCIMAWMGFFTV